MWCVWICGNLENLFSFRSMFTVFQKLTVNPCFSCAKELLHLSRKHWPWDDKNVAGLKSNLSKQRVYHIHAWQRSKIMHGSFASIKSQYYVDSSLRKKRCCVCFFKLVALTAEKVFVTVMQIDLLVCQLVDDFSSLSVVLVCDAHYLHCCNLDCDLCAIAAHNCSPLSTPGESSGCLSTSQSSAELVELTSLFPLLHVKGGRISFEIIWCLKRKDREVRSLEKHHMAEWGFTEGHCQWLV